MSDDMVWSGLSREEDRSWQTLRGARVGLLANHTAVNRRGRVLWQLLKEGGVDLEVLFSPEHGLWGVEQDMAPVLGQEGPAGIRLHSLYGSDAASLDPPEELLAGLDVVVFDIQDVGSRYYTYQASLHRLLRLCSGTRTRVLVLDRPNPLGSVVEGNTVQADLRSFVGQAPLPNRHGMTVGELAGMFVHQEELDVELVISRLKGWSGAPWWRTRTRELWVPPSPNMPTRDTALVYPGACLLEGTELSEGRGTTNPFLLAGAPWMEPLDALIRFLENWDRAVICRETRFKPSFQKFAGKICRGIQVHVQDRDGFRPLRFYLGFLRWVRERWPEEFLWRRAAYEFVEDRAAFDLLAGEPWVRDWVEGLLPWDELEPRMAFHEEGFLDARQPFLLYSRTDEPGRE